MNNLKGHNLNKYMIRRPLNVLNSSTNQYYPKPYNKGGEKREKYGEILLDISKVFHGIGFNLAAYKSILENGIFSYKMAQESNISIGRNNRGYNLNDCISVSDSPVVNNTYNSGSFKVYTKKGITFVIEDIRKFKAKPGTKRDSGFIDESYVKGKIDKSKIKGIMVPEKMLTKPLSKIPILSPRCNSIATLSEKCNVILSEIDKECSFNGDKSHINNLLVIFNELREDDSMEFIEWDYKIEEIMNRIDRLSAQYIELAYRHKLNKNVVILQDVLLLYLPKDFKIYNTKGFTIS